MNNLFDKIRMPIRLLLLLVSTWFLAPVTGQNLYVDVAKKYGVTAADGTKRVSDKYAVGQDTLSTGLYWAWQRWKVEGMSYSTFRQTYLGCAIAKDIAWLYEATNNIKTGFQNTYVYADWKGAAGYWKANRTMQLPRAGMEGITSFGYWNGSTSLIFASLEFAMDDSDWWPANQTERRLFETPNSSLDGANFYSYNESFLYKNIHLTGPAKYGDGINRIGMYLRRPGECSKIDQINVAMFQNGIVIQGATPIDIGTVTAFWNEKCGVALAGSWGATVHANVISGDSNGELVGIHPGYGEESGGVISIALLKNEDAILPENAQAPWRGQITLYAEGQYSINVGVANNSRNNITTDAIFVVNPRLTNGNPQNSILRVGPHKGFKYRTTLQNLATGRRWEAPADYSARTFEHYSNGDRMLIDGSSTPTPGLVCNCPPLGFIRDSGSFDYVNCTPVRAGSGPVTPPTCNWVAGTTTCTDCVNGSQTCTTPYVSSIPGCTPTVAKPADVVKTQTCSVPITMTATVFCSMAPDGYGSGDGTKAIDGNIYTYWAACRSMQTGQEFIVDLGATKTIKGVSFSKAEWYANSYPREYTVWTRTGTGAWKQSGGKFTNTGNASATFTPVSCTAVKIVIGKTDILWSGNYWVISEFTVQQ